MTCSKVIKILGKNFRDHGSTLVPKRSKKVACRSVFISLSVVNVYSMTFMSSIKQVLVIEPANDWDQSEIVCPDVVNPGEFFLCKIDIPYGNKLIATVTLADNIYPVPNITTGPLNVPGIELQILLLQKKRNH
jgi:hypothetical protein